MVLSTEVNGSSTAPSLGRPGCQYHMFLAPHRDTDQSLVSVAGSNRAPACETRRGTKAADAASWSVSDVQGSLGFWVMNVLDMVNG